MNNQINPASLAKLVSYIASLVTTGTRFTSLSYVSKESGEHARHVVSMGIDYRKATEKSLEELTRKLPHLETELEQQAAQELIKSYSQSLLADDTNTVNPNYTCADVYENILPGLKIHKETGQLYVYGLTVSKKVIAEGVHKKVNSRPLTIAKRNLERDLPRGKFRQFILSVDNLESVRCQGETLEIA